MKTQVTKQNLTYIQTILIACFHTLHDLAKPLAYSNHSSQQPPFHKNSHFLHQTLDFSNHDLNLKRRKSIQTHNTCQDRT